MLVIASQYIFKTLLRINLMVVGGWGIGLPM